MGFISIIVNAYDDPKEQRQFDVISGNLARYCRTIPGDAILLGNVRLGLHALDAVLLTRNGIMVLEFKNYSGDIRVSENVWENPLRDGSVVIVKGGSGGKTPREQAEINRRGVMNACRDSIGDVKINALRPDSFFTVAVVFNHSVNVKVVTPSAQPRWLKITDNDNLLSVIDMFAKNPAVFTDTELCMIKDAIGVRQSYAIFDKVLEIAQEFYYRGQYKECCDYIEQNRKHRYKEIDYLRAKCMCQLNLPAAIDELIRLRREYSCNETYYDEACIVYEGRCGKRKDKRLALKIAEDGMKKRDEQSTSLYNKILKEISYDDSLQKAHEQNKYSNDVFYNVLAYLSLPIWILISYFLPVSMVFPLVIPALVVYLAFYLSSNMKFAGVLKIIPDRLKIKSFSPQNLDFIKDEDITETGKFYAKSFFMVLLPLLLVELLLLYLMNNDWMGGIDLKYFMLNQVFVLAFVFYSLLVAACVIRLLIKYGKYLIGESFSIYTIGADRNIWEIQPNARLLKESCLVAGKLCLVAMAVAVVVVVLRACIL